MILWMRGAGACATALADGGAGDRWGTGEQETGGETPAATA